ncbi:MAG TPA: carboxypeptidase-like regulatory domain-containing protein [Actinophytocola sp.]|jgi:hypothetical protein|uniref:carboxypeptidase-like regulatory domain-containing protein n=1 Tax=Actinophytocola sp. TaxID=1872138 RepID=UPI002F943FD4
MKRTYVVLMLMFVLVACGSTPGTPRPESNSDEPSTGPPVTDPTTTDPPDDTSYTVSGQVVDRETGQPYPNAWVRFGWLASAGYEMETHTVTDGGGTYAIQLPPGQYQVTAGDSCDLNAGFDIVGRNPDDVMITVPGADEVDFVEYPIVPGYDSPAPC